MRNTVFSPNSWYGNFVERHSFCIFRVICLKLCGNYAFPQNLQTRKLGEIMIFSSMISPKWAKFIQCSSAMTNKPKGKHEGQKQTFYLAEILKLMVLTR